MRKIVQFVFCLTLSMAFHPTAIAASSVWDKWEADCIEKIEKAREKGYRKDFNHGKIVCCAFYIDKKGGLTGLKMHRSSGYRAIDKTAMAILEKSAPFKPFESLTAYKTGVIATFKDDIKLKFYQPDKMPPNYDAKKQFIDAWFRKAAEKIKQFGYQKSKDESGVTKWVKMYELEKPTTCTFRLGANGEVYDLVVSKSSGDDKIDRLAKQLVSRVAPFHMVSVSQLRGSIIDVIFAEGDVKMVLKNPDSNSENKN